MRRLALAVLVTALVWLAAVLSAQTAPKVYWVHDGTNVSYFEIVVDSVTPGTNVGVPTPSDQTYSYALPALSSGVHTVGVRACNASAQCSTVLAITVVKL